MIGNYRGDFLKNHKDKIKGKVVLELAAGDGHVSCNILAEKPAKFFVTDGSMEGIFAHNGVKDLPGVEIAKLDILHDLPEFFNTTEFIDTVVCTGYLYHTCHPLWALEQMVIGRPKWLYLESNFFKEDGVIIWGQEQMQDPGEHITYPGAISKNLGLPEYVIVEALGSIGYELTDYIGGRTIPDSDDSGYAKFWSTCTGMWFTRNEE